MHSNMPTIWRSVLVLAACLAVVTSEFNPDICNVVKENFGVIPPPIPTNFELRAEFVDYNHKSINYEEMYFDHLNNRGKFMFLSKGIEQHFLFDYEVQQVVQYDILHPGVGMKSDPLSHVCTAVEMEDSEHVDIFGYILSPEGARAKMFNANQALRFGGQYAFAFNGSRRMKDRGILVDDFVGCVYDDYMDATINSTFSFTSKQNMGVGTAGGTTEADVTGIENGMLSVPIKNHMFGSMTDTEEEGPLLFNETFHYFWFKGEPEFKRDVFKIPPYLYCTKYRGRRNMTQFPVEFSTRVQRTVLQRDILGKMDTTEVTSFESIFYHKEKNLARRDYTPGELDSDIKSKFQNSLPVRTVYDFNQGLLYISNIASGRCYIRTIEHNDFFESAKDDMFITMATPEEIFQMQAEDMEYKGKDFTRDIECDVYAGKYKDKIWNATYVKETYISTNGWHEDVDEKEEFGVPVKHTIIQNELNGELKEGVTSYSFLKFKAFPPALRNFDVSNCIETQRHKDFAILLTISDETKNLLYDYRDEFLDTAQNYINEVTQLLSPVRVQRLRYRTVSKGNTRAVLLVTLVDKIKLKTRVPFSQRGATLDEAAANLQKFIDYNQFAIKFYAPGSSEMTLVPALRGSLYVKTATGDLTYYAPMPDIPIETVPKVLHDDPVELEEDEGMTSGHLALLGFAMLFIGIGIGVAVMYLYVRDRTESRQEDRIHLSLKDNKEEIRIEVPSISNVHEETQ